MEWYQDTFIIKFLNSRPVLRQFIKFSLIGVLNTIVDFVAYVFFTRVIHWHYLLAAFLAFLLAVTSSFLLNRYWTFKLEHKLSAKEYSKFILVAAGGLLLTMIFLYILVDKFFWHDLWAKLFTIIIVINWNFWLQKFWTFKVK
ncbi:GtrA family protein [bacterium]|jgi:putative flippase GtrA|nr:GtrA family protein [Candidatus Komeilibacteria bacterium]MBT7553148.1 GtrA family protein [bacterium]